MSNTDSSNSDTNKEYWEDTATQETCMLATTNTLVLTDRQ